MQIYRLFLYLFLTRAVIDAGVTILLSLTVFLNLVAESMPTTSDAVPLIGTTQEHINYSELFFPEFVSKITYTIFEFWCELDFVSSIEIMHFEKCFPLVWLTYDSGIRRVLSLFLDVASKLVSLLDDWCDAPIQ